MGLGFVGASGAKGATDALREIIADRLREEATQRLIAQQEFENSMQVRAADTGDRRFDRTQGFTEKMGEGSLDISRGNLGLSRERFGLERDQTMRGNTLEDQDRAAAAAESAGRVSFLNEVAGQQTDPLKRNTVRGLRYNVQLPDLRSAADRGRDTGIEEGAAFDAGGRRVRQSIVDMGTHSGIAQADAASRRARENAPPDTAAAEAADTAAEVRRIAKALREHKGLDGAFGVLGAWTPTLRQETADAEALLASLQGLLTLQNMGKMKGVLSDKDMQVLRQASTTLNGSMSESAARAELQRLEEVMSRIGGGQQSSDTSAAERAAALIKKYGGG